MAPIPGLRVRSISVRDEHDDPLKSNPMAPVVSLQQRRRSTNPLPITVTVGGSYQYLEGPDSLLGHGTFGSVYRAYNMANGKTVAIKKMDNRKIKVEELSILRCLDSEYVVHLLEVFVPDNEPFTYLVMELCDTDLSKHLKRLDQASGLSNHNLNVVISDMAKGYAALYHMSIIHMDIKPENIMVCYEDSSMAYPGGRIAMCKLCDFGSSRIANTAEDTFTTLAGTPLYMAPEIAANVLEENEYNHQVDMWSLGVVLFQCATGQVPFNERYLCKLILYAATANYSCYSCPDLPESLTNECRSIITQLLQLNSETRLTPPNFISLVTEQIDTLRQAVSDSSNKNQSSFIESNIQSEAAKNSLNGILNDLNNIVITGSSFDESLENEACEILLSDSDGRDVSSSTPRKDAAETCTKKVPPNGVPSYIFDGGWRSERSGSFDVNLVKHCQINRSINDSFETSKVLAHCLRDSHSLDRSLGSGSNDGDLSSDCKESEDDDSSEISESYCQNLSNNSSSNSNNKSYLSVTNIRHQKGGRVLNREESMEDVIEEDEETLSRSSGGFNRNSSFRSVRSLDLKTNSSEENFEVINGDKDDDDDDDDSNDDNDDGDDNSSSENNRRNERRPHRQRKMAKPAREITPDEIRQIIEFSSAPTASNGAAKIDSSNLELSGTVKELAKCSGIKLVKLYAGLASCSYCLFQAREHLW